MTLLFKIIYAVHANGTHHKLALDALRTLECDNAEKWRRLFLKNAELYMDGSKAPDKEFKDFKNHVLHVHDGYWGGAPEKVESWYKLLVRALQERNWSEAVWSAGILSHYYTDPIHPFHTAQSKAETDIHRAVEWSISKSYNELRPLGLAGPAPVFNIGTDEHWLKDMVIAGAETSNLHYNALIAGYDFKRGVVDPPLGLDDVCRSLVGGLTVYAATGVGKILDRAIAEAGVEPPDVKLTAQTVLAGLKIPLKWVTRKMNDADSRRQVEAMYDELQSTGSVDKTLSNDDRIMRDLYEKEVRPLRKTRAQRDRARRRESTPTPQGGLPPVAPKIAQPVDRKVLKSKQTPLVVSKSNKPKISKSLSEALSRRTSSEAVPVPAASKPTQSLWQISPQSSVPLIDPAASKTQDGTAECDGELTPLIAENREPRSNRGQEAQKSRFHLKPADDVEAAPSIGRKTAHRLYDIGIITVADLIAADPKEVAAELKVKYITKQIVTDWQDQSQLVMDIPDLRGTHAQLLVGAGLRTSEAVATADTATTYSSILRFAGTRDGQRILREGQPPDLEKITAWLNSAREAYAA